MNAVILGIAWVSRVLIEVPGTKKIIQNEELNHFAYFVCLSSTLGQTVCDVKYCVAAVTGLNGDGTLH